MSIRYIVGNPGSGKSYMGAKVLYDHFLRPKKANIFSFFIPFMKAYIKNDEDEKINLNEILEKVEFGDDKYLVAYTNINEFKFDLSDRIKKLDFDELLSKLSILYAEYKHNKESNDQHLIKLAEELNLHKALFVIDEIHNFFDKDNEILKWWLTYHRHLYQEMYLITQDLDLVSNEYKKVAEFFYKAVDSSKRFFSKKFRYFQYSSYKLYQKDLISKFHVDFEQEIFNLYHSGNDGIGKSAVKKFAFIAFLIFVFVFIIFKIFISAFFTPDQKEQKSDLNTTKNTQIQRNSRILDKSSVKERLNPATLYYYTFTCIENYCSFENSTDRFRYEILYHLMSKTNISYQIKRSNGLKNSVSYDVLLEDDVFQALNIKFNDKGNADEKNSNSSFFGLGGSSTSYSNQK